MNVELIPVPLEQKQILYNLMQLYQHDLSAYTDRVKMNNDATYTLPYFDEYWTEDDRHAFFIHADEALAGFVLVNRYTVKTPDAYSIAEFFILNPFRGSGVGYTAAHDAFGRFPGRWEVRVVENNKPAFHFWQKCIKAKTDHIEEVLEDGRFIFSFTIS